MASKEIEDDIVATLGAIQVKYDKSGTLNVEDANEFLAELNNANITENYISDIGNIFCDIYNNKGSHSVPANTASAGSLVTVATAAAKKFGSILDILSDATESNQIGEATTRTQNTQFSAALELSAGKLTFNIKYDSIKTVTTGNTLPAPPPSIEKPKNAKD